MVRKKLIVRKIENPSSLQVTYCKRKDGIIKKASELAVLCDTDVGLVMFSPTGRLTSFASNGRLIININFWILGLYLFLPLLCYCFSNTFWDDFCLAFCRIEDIFLRYIDRPNELRGGCVLKMFLILFVVWFILNTLFLSQVCFIIFFFE